MMRMNLIRRAIAFVLLALASQAAFANERPNIVFVMIDDLGAEQVGVYGGETFPTPNMDRLAGQGMRFDNAFAQPMCMIARATLLSGRYGFRSGLPRNIDGVATSPDGWGKDEITVANLLQQAGYTTAISGKWHLGQFDIQPDHLTDKGFEYQNAWAWIVGKKRTRRYWETTYYRERKFVKDEPGIFGPDEFCRYVTDFMTEHKEDKKPFFIYYPMVLVHSPFPQTPENIDDPPEGWTAEDNLRTADQKKWSAENYASMVPYTDRLVGRVADKIEELGIAENTLLIVTADNGSYGKSATQYRGRRLDGGKGSVADIGGRVPFICCWKGKITPGVVNQELVDFTDILPTLVELAGGELPKDRRLDGVSFFPQLLGEDDARSRDWVFLGNAGKGMIRADKFSLDAAGQLYDLREDRYAPQPVAQSQYKDLHRQYHDRLDAAMKELGHPYTAGPRVKGKKAKKKGKARQVKDKVD